MTKIRELRKAKGLTIKQLAKIAHVNVSTIQAYETNIRDINIANIGNLAKLAIALGCNITDLITNCKLKEILKRASL